MNNKIALDFLDETARIKEKLEIAFLDLGSRLYKISSERMWEAKGLANFEDYLMEIKLSPATASKLISIYETFVIKFDFKTERLAEAGGWSNLYVLSRLDLKTKKEADDWIEKTINWSRQDLEQEVKERLGKVDPKCSHPNTYLLRICKDCNFKIKVYES